MAIAKMVWVIAGIICVGLAFIGVFLPILPTTPFLLLAAYFFAKSSKRLHSWLLNHKTFGSLIKNWQETGSIAKSAKVKAVIVMIASIMLSFLFEFSILILAIQTIILGLVAIFILTRPLPKKNK